MALVAALSSFRRRSYSATRACSEATLASASASDTPSWLAKLLGAAFCGRGPGFLELEPRLAERRLRVAEPGIEILVVLTLPGHQAGVAALELGHRVLGRDQLVAVGLELLVDEAPRRVGVLALVAQAALD